LQARPASIALSKLRVPVPLALGKYELLSDLELKEAIADLNAERDRRIDERGYDFGLT
jgi:hypothetical protein